MSTTRRQSGRLAKQALSIKETNDPKSQEKSPKRGSATINSDDEEESDEEHDVESDASQYERPVKRQKTSTKKSTARSGTVWKRKADKKCYITPIPLAILLEIFGHLEPKDLIRLARTNHAFRGQLLSTASKSIWEAARENVDGPDCPPDLSEHRWARLLYGPARCQSCGANNIQRVDYGLRRRACTKCLKANLVVAFSFKNEFPHLDKTVLDLLPYTNIGGFAHGHASKNRFYWIPDIKAMAKELEAHKHDVEMRVIGAQKKLEDLKNERIAMAEAAVDHAAICTAWLRQLAIRRQENDRQQKEQRHKAIEAKFLNLGYLEADVVSIRYQTRVYLAAAFTDRMWDKIRPELEPIVQKSKEKRLEDEREARIRARTQLVEDIYKEYKKTLAPSQWRYLPGLYEVAQLPAFSILVNAPDDMNVETVHFKEAAESLPEFAAPWPAAREVELVQLVHDARTSDSGLSSQSSSATASSPLDLATTVFTCAQHCNSTTGGVLFGRDAAVHRCREPNYGLSTRTEIPVKTILKFSTRLSTAAASIVAQAGLDATRATCAEMDGLDLRLLCIACPPRRDPATQKTSYDAYSWREAVSHFLFCRYSTPIWRRLTSAESQKVRANELDDSTLAWSCSHCPLHLDNWQTLEDVTGHVKTVHAIANPTFPGDLFRYLNASRAPEPFFSPAVEFHCKRCPQSKGKGNSVRRGFVMRGVIDHLKNQHKVSNPGPKDWEQVAQSI
ncbi:hypothetical protein B0H17DRAFT_1331006 [Mycena rosella]|uniref:F-box domain-containing protein n=1 Tax=Mycena rosella TaxID=1033263 RepID=A0AAD7GEY1_MYCRO|nr:hypothetical protein B0H17DRAFT_1331006 [Mycena rosella]